MVGEPHDDLRRRPAAEQLADRLGTGGDVPPGARRDDWQHHRVPFAFARCPGKGSRWNAASGSYRKTVHTVLRSNKMFFLPIFLANPRDAMESLAKR